MSPRQEEAMLRIVEALEHERDGLTSPQLEQLTKLGYMEIQHGIQGIRDTFSNETLICTGPQRRDDDLPGFRYIINPEDIELIKLWLLKMARRQVSEARHIEQTFKLMSKNFGQKKLTRVGGRHARDVTEDLEELVIELERDLNSH